MHNLVLSPIDPETLIKRISDQVTANILFAISKQETNESPFEDHLTLKEAAKFLSLSPNTIYGLVHEGKIPSMKPSNQLYFDKSDLLEYLKKNKRSSVQDLEDGATSYLKPKRQK